jgi:NTE family protein
MQTADATVSHNRDPLLIDLALQGGGAHGAFTWGVLDRLLEEPWLQIAGISGTSAGAMNSAVLVHGHSLRGNLGARDALEGFWRRIAEAGRFSPLQRGPIDILLGRWTLDNSPAWIAMDMMSRLFSPYDLNLSEWNPLRDILKELVNFEQVARSPVKLFITATNVATGRARVFRNRDITPKVLLASACLTTMFQAIEIDGDAYWDGGYSGNPTITPLVRVHFDTPHHRSIRSSAKAPRAAMDVLKRRNEVAFNAVLLKELRMIALLRQVADPGHEEGEKWSKMRVHYVPNEVMTQLSASSKLIVEWDFFCLLRDKGRHAAQAFLKRHVDDLGRRSTLDLDVLLKSV